MGEELKLSENSSALCGTEISISLKFPSIFSNLCGWFWRITKSFFGATGDKIWLVLHDEMIYCYESPYSLHKGAKSSHSCSEIEDIVGLKESTTYFESPIMEISFRGSSIYSNSLILAWGDDTSIRKGLWKQALYKYCSH